jgi:hypothetical protein
MKKLVFLGILVMFAASSAFAGGIWDELTSDQQAAIRKGEQVFITQDVSTSDWPKTWVYQAIDATPEEVAALYFDFDAVKTYVPNVKKSQISKRIDPRTLEVDYTIAIPILRDEDYTARNTLSEPSTGTYRVDWTLVRASSTKSSIGNIRVESLGAQSLFRYYNFVVPGSSLAGLVKGKALKQVRDTVTAIAEQVEKERTSDQATLQRQVQALRAALAAQH